MTCTFPLESDQDVLLCVILQPLGDQDSLVVLALRILQPQDPHRSVVRHHRRPLCSSPAKAKCWQLKNNCGDDHFLLSLISADTRSQANDFWADLEGLDSSSTTWSWGLWSWWLLWPAAPPPCPASPSWRRSSSPPRWCCAAACPRWRWEDPPALQSFVVAPQQRDLLCSRCWSSLALSLADFYSPRFGLGAVIETHLLIEALLLIFPPLPSFSELSSSRVFSSHPRRLSPPPSSFENWGQSVQVRKCRSSQ